MGLADDGTVADEGEAAGVEGTGLPPPAVGDGELPVCAALDGGLAVCAELAGRENAKQSNMAAIARFFNAMAQM
jgi:hypothetical protein